VSSSFATVEAQPWTEREDPWIPPRLRWTWIMAAWSVVGVIAVLQTFAGYALRGEAAEEWPWALVQGLRWLCWIPITPLVFALARAIPLERQRLARAIALHLGLAFAIALVYESAMLLFSLWLDARLNPIPEIAQNPPLMLMFTTGILSRLVSDAFIYAAVLGLAAGLAFRNRLRQRELRSAQLETELALAQVQALKMQVHPHFLFNTLHAVNVLIREDPVAATQMVSLLGDLLRLTLSRATAHEVPFSTELEILQVYLDIERRRFHDRLEVSYDVAPETRAALVPDLILQPLLENAIKHGVNAVAGPARIVVRSAREQDRLVLEIADNGRGPPEDQPMTEGIGLATTRARLERLYGAAQELRVERLAHGGCLARVVIPFRLAPPLATGPC
jgi:signal transduction histidine kinase